MKGYQDRTPDIYDDVVKFLVKEIGCITNENAEVIVCPFQERILDNWSCVANNLGKRELIDKIIEYNNTDVTNTNISGPVEYAKSALMKPGKRNLLYILTDGKQTGGNGPLLSIIEKWREFASLNNAYLRYVALTEAADDDKLKELMDTMLNVEYVKPEDWKEQSFLDFWASKEQVDLNIKESKEIEIPFKCSSEKIGIPSGAIVRIKSASDAPINISKEVDIINNKIVVELRFDYQQLKNMLPEVFVMPLYIELVNKDEIFESQKILATLTSPQIKLNLINKPEKTLTIRIKKQ